MTSPRSIRFEARTLDKLASYASRHPGMTGSGAAALLVEEGLRMDAHPGIVFREGPTGRRAVLVTGPDVWEVIKAVRDARAAEPELSPTEILELVRDNTGLDEASIRVAVDYYGAFPDEIEVQLTAADDAETELERALEHTSRLLGA